MRFLIISEGGDGVGLALRLKNEGHEAKIWIRDSVSEGRGKGLVDFADFYSSGQTVIADCTGAGALLDLYQQEDIPVFGGSSWADKLESDRKYSESVFKRVGIETPKSERVTTWDGVEEVIERLGQDTNGKVVLKPEGRLSGVVPSYVTHDGEDAFKMLEHFKNLAGTGDIELVIQEFIPDGIALSTEGWFNGTDWIEGMFNHTIERKQFLNDDLGPSGGCSGNLVWRCDSNDPYARELLIPLTETLRKHVYRGAIDVNAVVTKDGVYALEFTPRFGYDAFPTLLHGLCDFDFGCFLGGMARGDSRDDSLSADFSAGVRLSLPPWPSEKFHAVEGIPINGFNDDSWFYFYPYDVAKDEEELCCSGGYGILGVMSYENRSIGSAFAWVYQEVSKLKIPNLQYRTDLGDVFFHDYRELGKLTNGSFEDGWLGVDLDGTLAKYSGWSEEIGEPIPAMVSKVKRWLSEGKEVRILTARGSVGSGRHEQLMKVHNWVYENIGSPLEVTSKKDPEMIRLYDDRVRQVEANAGVLV